MRDRISHNDGQGAEGSTNRRLRPADYRRAADLREALRRFSRYTIGITRAHKLTPQRYELLLMIKTATSGAALRELGERLQLGQSTVTELVHRAEYAGLERRQLNRRKRGEIKFHLTPEGEQRLAGACAELAAERRRLSSILSGFLDAEEADDVG
jgi:DNA-binding MarR family transcriptional regulator